MSSLLQVKSRKRLAKTVLVFVVLFAVCWLPNHVIYLYRSYHYSQVNRILSHLFTCYVLFTQICILLAQKNIYSCV